MNALRNRLLQLLQDPRVGKVLQDARVQRGIMRGIRFRGRVEEALEQRLERLAGRLNLATKREIRQLKRAIRQLEDELRSRED